MGKCVGCGCETCKTATVYVGTAGESTQDKQTSFQYAPRTEYLCEACVQKHSNRSHARVILCLFLQLGWFSTARHGWLSLSGVLGAVLGLYGLWRLGTLIYSKYHAKYKADQPLPKLLMKELDYESEASDLYKEILSEQEEMKETYIQDIREYRRKHIQK